MTAPSLTLDALTTVCATSEIRPHLRVPFAVEITGAPWTVATDGMRLLAVRHDYGAVPAKPGIDGSVRDFFVAATAPEARPTDLTPLREFFTAHAPPAPGTCEACFGKSSEDCESCEGDGEVECECLDCGDEHTKKCRVCDGTGGWVCPRCKDRDAKVPVQVGAVVYDARIAAPLLAALPGTEARFRQEGAHRMTTFAGDDWFAVLMPMRCDAHDWRELPTLALPAEPVAA